MANYKYIAEVTEQELLDKIVIPCKTETDCPCLLIRNAKNRTVVSSQKTDNLLFQFNKTLERDGDRFFFHIVTSQKNDFFAQQQFDIIYEYIFRKITEPVESSEFASLISSIEEYFSLTPDSNKNALQIGVFGELLFIKYCYENGITSIFEKYHKDFNYKHDVEFSEKIRLEVKTTSGEKRIHHFKHNQIFRNDLQVFVASILLEKSQEGKSLFDMFKEVMELTKDPDTLFGLQKTMKLCGVSEFERGLSFSYEKAYLSIRLFDSKNLPRLEVEEPKGVTCVEYDVDCSIADSMSIDVLAESIYLNKK